MWNRACVILEWKVVPRALEVAQWLYTALCELSLLTASAEDCKGGHCQSLGRKKTSKMIHVSRSGWDGVNFPTASHMVLCFALVTGRVLVAPQSRGSAGTVSRLGLQPHQATRWARGGERTLLAQLS